MSLYVDRLPVGYQEVAQQLLQLKPPPREGWQNEWDALLTRNTWLRRKLDRRRRVQEHCQYVANWLPELETSPPAVVVDIGPGLGELLEIAQHFGHQAIGIDARSGKGGMGDDYLLACRLMHERQGLQVHYTGLQDWLTDSSNYRDILNAVLAINMRGSIEQCFAHLLAGPPHHEHHKANRLVWRDELHTFAAFRNMFSIFRVLLKPNGVVLIHANGTGSRESEEMYDRLLRQAATTAGLETVLSSELRLHKFWRRN